MRWLDSCKFDKLHPVMVLVMIRAENIYQQQNAELWITSINDKEHMVGSKHYDGKAVDIRSRDLESPELTTLLIKKALGPEFTVLYENTHIHIQFNGD